jgi:glycerophosphoryl diester phosphodiesterase
MGHRGARDRAPENTLRSFKALLESNVSVVEFDIHQSVDGVWIVHHDESLGRTMPGTGLVSEKAWTELHDIRTNEGDPLPRLEDVLSMYRDTPMELQIEVKSSGEFQKLGEILNKSFELSRITVISFNHRWLHEIKTKHPTIKTACLLSGLPLNPVEIARAAKADGISLSVSWIDEVLVKECHDQGLTVTAWNADDIEVFKRMKSIGVDILGTNVPFTAVEWE